MGIEKNPKSDFSFFPIKQTKSDLLLGNVTSRPKSELYKVAIISNLARPRRQVRSSHVPKKRARPSTVRGHFVSAIRSHRTGPRPRTINKKNSTQCENHLFPMPNSGNMELQFILIPRMKNEVRSFQVI